MFGAHNDVLHLSDMSNGCGTSQFLMAIVNVFTCGAFARPGNALGRTAAGTNVAPPAAGLLGLGSNAGSVVGEEVAEQEEATEETLHSGAGCREWLGLGR